METFVFLFISVKCDENKNIPSNFSVINPVSTSKIRTFFLKLIDHTCLLWELPNQIFAHVPIETFIFFLLFLKRVRVTSHINFCIPFFWSFTFSFYLCFYINHFNYFNAGRVLQFWNTIHDDDDDNHNIDKSASLYYSHYTVGNGNDTTI